MATAFAYDPKELELDAAISRLAVNAVGTFQTREDTIYLIAEMKAAARDLGFSPESVMPFIQGKVSQAKEGVVTDLHGNIVKPDKDEDKDNVNEADLATMPLAQILLLKTPKQSLKIGFYRGRRAQKDIEERLDTRKLAEAAAPAVANAGATATHLTAPTVTPEPNAPVTDTSTHVKTTFDRVDLKDNGKYNFNLGENSPLLTGGMNYGNNANAFTGGGNLTGGQAMRMTFRPAELNFTL